MDTKADIERWLTDNCNMDAAYLCAEGTGLTALHQMVRAYNNGIEPQTIKSYLEKASVNPLQENVIHSFDDWQLKVGKVRIRTVTLLEADDAFLLEELIHATGMKTLLGDKIAHGVVITEERNQTRAKTIAEKNGWLVAADSKPGRGRGRKKNT